MGKVATKDANTAVDLFSSDRPDYIGDTRRGSEDVGSQDTSLPRLELIQDLSPQRDKDEAAYIEGAESGMIFNSATSELLGNEVTFIPVYFRSEYLVWGDRQQGGGFAGAYLTEDEALAAIDQLEKPEIYEAIKTHQQFGMLVHPDKRVEEVVISMAKTKMKVSKRLNTMIQTSGGDRFARGYKLTVEREQNAKGKFFNWGVKQLGFVPKDLYEKAEALYAAIKGGERDVNRDYSTESKSDLSDAKDM